LFVDSVFSKKVKKDLVMIKKTKGKLENQVMKECTFYLTQLENQGKLYFQRTNTGSFKIKEDGKKDRFMKTGKKGGADFVVCLRGGRYLMIEAKREIGGIQSPDQIWTQNTIDRLDGIYMVVTSGQELIKFLNELV
jgi:hypothetical protein